MTFLKLDLQHRLMFPYCTLYFQLNCPAQEEEAHELSKLMMSKKTKRLYGRMQNSIQQKQGALEKLKEKRAALDASSSTSSTKTEDSKQKSSTRSKNAKSEPKAVSKKQKVAGNK